MAKKTIVRALTASLVSVGIFAGFAAFSSPVSVRAECVDPMNCSCYPFGDPMNCPCVDSESNDCSCETNDCSCGVDPGCGEDCDSCCNGADCAEDCEPFPECDPCLTDPCADGCPDAGECCGLEGNEFYCCEHPEDVNFCNETCGGVVKPYDGKSYDCCRPAGSGPNGADAWCLLEGSRMCRDQNICNEGGGGCAIGGDTVCAVSIVHSCNDNADCCNPCVAGPCYNPNDPSCGGGDTTCTYSFDYDGTVGCDGVTRPEGGGTVTITDVFTGTVECPPSSDYEAAAEIAIAQALQSAGHPADNNGAAPGCGCAAGTIECDGQCIPDTEECCPDGSIPDPVYGCTVCGPGEIPCNGACIPDTEVCCPAGTYFDLALNQCVTCGAGQRYCPLQRRCILETQCCDPDNFQYCPNRQECIPKTECCDPTHVACPTCRPAAECVDMCLGQATGGEYCAEVVAEGGATNSPWAAVYPTDLALGGFFAPSASGRSFAQVKAAQSAARDDGDPATVEMPLVGRVVTLAGGGSCTAQICDHGQECALYVGVNGRTSAACVDTICDVCDPDSACFSLENCGCNPILDPFRCCENNPDETGVALGDSECILPPRGVAIEVLPNLINKGGSCVVLWASQGMASTTVVGEGMDAGPNLDLRHLSAGIATVSNVQTSTLFKIVGRGVDGQTYEATDLCATNPSIGEF